MTRRRIIFALSFLLAGGATALYFVAPARFDATVEWGEQSLEGLPEPVVIAGVVLVVIGVWILAMIATGKLLYWGWKRIDGYVLWLWNELLPDSPIVKFGVGLTFMALVFLVGPLVVLQALDFMGDSDDPVRDQPENDDSNNETTNTTETDSSISVVVPVEPYSAGWVPPPV